MTTSIRPRSALVVAHLLLSVAICLSSRIAVAGDLFVADGGSGNIYEFTPMGTESVFASLSKPIGLAFDRSGDLFVGDPGNGQHLQIHAKWNANHFCRRIGPSVGLGIRSNSRA